MPKVSSSQTLSAPPANYSQTDRPGTGTQGHEAPFSGPSGLGLYQRSQSFRAALKVRHYVDGAATVFEHRDFAAPQSAAVGKAKTEQKKRKAAELKAAHEAYLAKTGGVRKQAGLTSKAARKVKRATRLIAHSCRYNAFVTLTFGQWVPDQETAKRLLSMWFRRLNRKYGAVPYVWVAELQERGAIHFHIYIGRWVDKAWLNDSWNAVVNIEAIARNEMPQRLLPNVRGGKAMKGRYMAKAVGLYMAKVDAAQAQERGEDISARQIVGNTYGMDTQARTLVKGKEQAFLFIEPNDLADAFEGAVDAAEGQIIAFGDSFTLGFTWNAPILLEALGIYADFTPT